MNLMVSRQDLYRSFSGRVYKVALRMNRRNTGYLGESEYSERIQFGNLRCISCQHQEAQNQQKIDRSLERNLLRKSARTIQSIGIKLTTLKSNKDIPTLLNPAMA
jgi:hypothetical protein